MPKLVAIPARPGFPAAQLYARISTPGNIQSDSVDPAYPTIIFIHHLWGDSFSFYPQFDDPTFFEHFNLVAIDLRGHGLSKSGPMEDPFSWSFAADDVAAVMQELGIASAHILGNARGSITALRLASRYPDMVESVCIIGPTYENEPPAWKTAFEESIVVLQQTVRDNDPEGLDLITLVAFEHFAGDCQTPAIIEMREEVVDLLLVALPYAVALIQTRTQDLSALEADTIRCPIVLLRGADDHCDLYDEEDKRLVALINKGKPVSRASRQIIDGVPRGMTLTSPNIVNPLLSAFFTTPSMPFPSSPLSPGTARSICRRPSTPRDITGFIIPPPPKLAAGTLTLGEVLDREAREREKASGGREVANVQGGVRMTVEVLVVVDEET